MDRRNFLKSTGSGLSLALLPSLALAEVSPGERTVAYYEAACQKAGIDPSRLVNFSIGQSHIDAAWLWRKKQTRDKCLKTFGNAIKHMEKYPDFHFSQSAPQYYEWVMEDDPALFEQIKRFEKEGRWEIVGGQWVEPDNNMPDGESFCRQRLYGMRFFHRHFGHAPEISWLLDSFGYQWNLPQVLAKSGAKYFWTNKLTWNDATVFPFHFFWWEGPDGSRVLAYFIQQCPGSGFPAPELGKYHDTRYLLPEGSGEFAADYSTDPAMTRERLSGEWLDVFGIFYGKGDGGHGPTEDEILGQLALRDKGYTRLTTAAELFSALEPYKERAPVWKDELYLEYHRGCQTTVAFVKRANRETEQLMRSAEIISSVGARMGLAYPAREFEDIWKLVLLNQFHDILPGTSIPEVYEDAKLDYDRILQSATSLNQKGLAHLASQIDTGADRPNATPVVAWNNLSWKRSGTVAADLPAADARRVMDSDGNEVLSQPGVTDRGRSQSLFFRADNVPSMGYKTFFVEPGQSSPNAASPRVSESADRVVMKNQLVAAAIDKRTGWIASLQCASTGLEFLGENGVSLRAWNDFSFEWPAWNIANTYQWRPLPMPGARTVAVTAQGPLFVEVTTSRRFMSTDITQVMRLFADDPMVYIATHFDFHEKGVIVKQCVDTTINADKVAADISYAVIERPTSPRTEAEKAQWEAPCQKWIDLSDGSRGLAILNDGKYGYSLANDGREMRLSLIRGALYHASAGEAVEVRREGKSEVAKTLLGLGEYTDQGPHACCAAILLHPGDWKNARLWRAGCEFNAPFHSIAAPPNRGGLPASGGFISLDNPDVYVGALKKAEDDEGLILRLVEAVGKPSSVKVTLSGMGKIAGADETDILEWNPKPIPAGADSFSVNMTPHEIKTVKLKIS